MRRFALSVTIIIFTLIFLISAYAHEYTSNDFWQHGSKWYSINTSASRRVDSAKYRYMYLDYSDDTDTCIGLNIIVNDNTKATQSALECTGFDVNFSNSSGESLDYFQIFAREGVKQEKGSNGTFSATCEAINSYKGATYRFFAEYHNLSKFAQSDKIILKIQLFDSESFVILSGANELKLSVPRLSIEPSTTQKSSKSKSKSKNSDGKNASSKSGSNKKKKYYTSTTAPKSNSNYSSKSKGGYYSLGKNSNNKVSTTKAKNNNGEEETDIYSKADIVQLEENKSALNTKQVIAISVISALAGSLIALIVILILKKKKHNSSVDDNKQ